jgi:hypothetical protein
VLSHRATQFALLCLAILLGTAALWAPAALARERRSGAPTLTNRGLRVDRKQQHELRPPMGRAMVVPARDSASLKAANSYNNRQRHPRTQRQPGRSALGLPTRGFTGGPESLALPVGSAVGQVRPEPGTPWSHESRPPPALS